jgi:hypothetical protein
MMIFLLTLLEATNRTNAILLKIPLFHFCIRKNFAIR